MIASDNIELSQDAAVVAALAGTAMSFSHSAEDQAERWLRALRLYGKVGTALQALGVGEAPLSTHREPAAGPPTPSPPLSEAAVEDVVRRARDHARERRGRLVCTEDLLFALLEAYAPLLDRALSARGASREELERHLAAMPNPAGTC